MVCARLSLMVSHAARHCQVFWFLCWVPAPLVVAFRLWSDKKRNSGWGNCGASLVDFRRFLGFSGGYFDSANRFDQLLRAECILLLPIKFLRRRLIVILYEKDCAMRALRPHSEEKITLDFWHSAYAPGWDCKRSWYPGSIHHVMSLWRLVDSEGTTNWPLDKIVTCTLLKEETRFHSMSWVVIDTWTWWFSIELESIAEQTRPMMQHAELQQKKKKEKKTMGWQLVMPSNCQTCTQVNMLWIDCVNFLTCAWQLMSSEMEQLSSSWSWWCLTVARLVLQ